MNNLLANYRKIVETLQQIESKMNFLNQKRTPRLSAIELIAIDLTSEFMGVDSESQLFRTLPLELLSRIKRSVYNRRKRKLFHCREKLRKQIANSVLLDTDYLIVDIYL